jgi:hypothetical protein
MVTDQTGAWVPGAHVVALNGATGAHFEARTNTTGEAAIQVGEEIYSLEVREPGFEVWQESGIHLRGEMHRHVTLRVASGGDLWPVEGPVMPLDHQPLVVQISLIPAGLLALPSRPVRRKLHWF